jgi:hypothetical protein
MGDYVKKGLQLSKHFGVADKLKAHENKYANIAGQLLQAAGGGRLKAHTVTIRPAERLKVPKGFYYSKKHGATRQYKMGKAKHMKFA